MLGTRVSPNLLRRRSRQKKYAPKKLTYLQEDLINERAATFSDRLGWCDDEPRKAPRPKAAAVGAATGRPGPHERDEIERFLLEIDEALALLDESGPGISGDRHE